MRELLFERANYAFKKRKTKQKQGKEYDVKDYHNGLSFLVKDTDVEKWRALLTIRYLGYFGGSTEAHIQMLRKVDPSGTILEEKQMINSAVFGTIKPVKQLTISVYRTTSRILIQGNRKAEWIEKELPIFIDVVENSNTPNEAVKLLESELKFSVPDMERIMHEAEVEALAKCTEIIDKAENNEENSDIEDFTLTEETNTMLDDIETRKKTKKLIMLAAATPSKKRKSVISKAAMKNNNVQTDSNTNAIELLELSLIEVTRNLQEKNDKLESTLENMKEAHEAAMKLLKKQNEEMSMCIEKMKKEQILLRNAVDGLTKKSFDSGHEKEVKQNPSIDGLEDEVRNISIQVNENQKVIAKQENMLKLAIQDKGEALKKEIKDLDKKLTDKISDIGTNSIRSVIPESHNERNVNLEIESTLKRQIDDIIKDQIKETTVILHNKEAALQLEVEEIEKKMNTKFSSITNDLEDVKKKTELLKQAKETVYPSHSEVHRYSMDMGKDTTEIHKSVSEQDPRLKPAVEEHKKNRNTYEKAVEVKEKPVISAQVILMMDSNRQYIDPGRFWFNHTCQKIVAGDAIQANKEAEVNEYKGVKHAILHIGTNDVENGRKSAERISNEIIQVALKLQANTKATTYVSLLPPRNDELNKKCSQVNSNLLASMPESIQVIDNRNIEITDLRDNKHLNADATRKLVANMKDSIRESIRYSRGNRNNRDNHGASANPSTRSDRDKYYNREKDNSRSRSEGTNYRGNDRDSFFLDTKPGYQRNTGAAHNFGGERRNLNGTRDDKSQAGDGKSMNSVMDHLRTFVSAITPML